MFNEIDTIIKGILLNIKPRPANRHAICLHYDHIYKILKEKGYTDYVACQISRSTLSNIFGSVKVSNACGSLKNGI
jgi:hypothetical protein